MKSKDEMILTITHTKRERWDAGGNECKRQDEIIKTKIFNKLSNKWTANSGMQRAREKESERASKERKVEWVKRHYKFNDYCYIHFKDSYVLERFLSVLFLFSRFFFFHLLLLVFFGGVVFKCTKCLSLQMNTNECQREKERERDRNSV